jgi:hypothetical protein
MPKVESIAEEVLATDVPPAVVKKGRKYTPKYGSFKDAAKAKARAARSAAAVQAALPPVPKKTSRQKLASLTTDGDLVDIWERRLVNPNHQETLPIRIKTPGMEMRWINLSNRGRFQRARYEQGWAPVHKDELVDEREIYGASYTTEGWVCRGEKQSEMLMKMPAAVWRQIQKRRAEINTLSYKKLRQNMGSAGHSHFKEKYGGSTGDIVEEAANNFVGSIKFGTEKVTTDELFE